MPHARAPILGIWHWVAESRATEEGGGRTTRGTGAAVHRVSGQRGADKEGLEGDGDTEPELEWHKEEGRGGGAELSRPEGGKGAPYAGWWRPEIGLGKLE